MSNSIPHFQEELDALKARLLEMGGLAEERVRTAIDALVRRDPALVVQVLEGDAPINQFHIEIDSRSFTLLALQQHEGIIKILGAAARHLPAVVERLFQRGHAMPPWRTPGVPENTPSPDA